MKKLTLRPGGIVRTLCFAVAGCASTAPPSSSEGGAGVTSSWIEQVRRALLEFEGAPAPRTRFFVVTGCSQARFVGNESRTTVWVLSGNAAGADAKAEVQVARSEVAESLEQGFAGCAAVQFGRLAFNAPPPTPLLAPTSPEENPVLIVPSDPDHPGEVLVELEAGRWRLRTYTSLLLLRDQARATAEPASFGIATLCDLAKAMTDEPVPTLLTVRGPGGEQKLEPAEVQALARRCGR